MYSKAVRKVTAEQHKRQKDRENRSDTMKEDENEDYEMLDDGTSGDEGNEKAGHSAYKVPKDKKLHLSGMYQNWFIDYASYVILERAVPHIEDGLKPVQRRILHAMKELDDGRFNKVANLVGSTMQYHPHGDASIYGALVTLGQKGLLIDTQGNWGNVLTGDQAAAPRYIEARLSHFALETVFSPKVTEWTKSYDGRKDEPITLPAKFPLLLIYGSEGIAVGLSCKILPHNFNEVCDAAVSYLKNEEFQLYPDFQTTGGYVDVSHYNDGERGGSVRIRSKIEKRDNKTLVITDLPYGKTGTALKESILKAAEKNKIKIRSVVDYTAEQAEIVVTLQPGVSSDKTIDALYAFTDCEVSLSPNCCVIKDHKPQFLTVSDVLRYSVDRTMDIFRKELEIQRNETLESLHFASLEKIFIEERIYKDKGFENAPNMDAAVAHIDSRLEPFKPQFYREVTTDDILRLMEIKMARILKFNTDKADNYIAALNERIKEIDYKLAHMVEHTIEWFEHLKQKYGEKFPRNTQIRNFDTIVASKVVEANEKLYINREEGFIGTNLKKDEYVCNCSDIDDIIIFYKDGRFKVVKVAEKLYVGKNVLYLNVFKRNDERTIYNVLYQDGRGGAIYMKRFAVTGITRDREYNLTQGKPGSKIVWFTANANGEAETLRITLKPKQRMKILQFDVDLANLGVKGKLAKGNLVTKAEVHRISLKEKGVSTLGDPDVLRINYDGRGTLLGEFFNDERILVIMKNGDFFTTTYDAENHYDEGILRIEKYRDGVVWTAVLNDADQGFPYIKRFTLESNVKKQRMIGDNPKSELLLLTDERYPRFEVKFGGADSFREPMIIDAEEYIGVKSFKAKGKRVSNWAIESITEIEPREVPEEEEVTPQQVAIDDDVVDTERIEADDVIDQEAVRDRLTGQMRIFDDADDEE